MTEDEQNKEFLEFQAAHSGDGIVVKGQQLCISAYENENVCALSHNLCSACREYVEIFNQFPDIRMSWRLAKQFNHDTIAMSPLRERPRYAIRYDENSNNFHDRRVITIFISEEEASEILNSTTSNPFDESHPIRKIIGGIDGCRSGCTSSIENCPVALFSVATGEIILSTEKVKEVEDNILRLEQEIYDFQYEVNFDTDAEKSEFQTRKRNANEKIKYLREKLSDFLTDTGDMMLLANMLQGNAKGVVNARPCIESFRNLLKKIGGDTDVLLRFFALNARILRTEASTDDTDRQLAKLEDDPILKTGSYLSPENKEKLRKVVSSDVLEQLLDPGALYDESKLMALSKLEDNVLRNLPALLLRKIFSAMMRKGNETDKEKFRHLLTTSEADFHACRKALQKREGAQNLIRNSFDYFKGHKLISTVDNDGSKISRDGFDPYSESLGINPENLFAWFVNIANELTANDKPVSKVEAKTPAPAPESSAEAKTPAPAPEPKTPAPASESSAEASGPPLVDSASASILNFLKDFSGIPEEMVAKLTTFCGCFENKETFTEFLQTFPNIKGEFFDIWEIIQGDKDTKELLLSVACGYVQGNRGPTDDVVMGNIVDRYGKESKGLGVIAAVASILSNEPGCNINENIDALLEGLTDEWSDYVSAEKVAKNVKSFFVGLLASALCRIEAKKVLEDVENSDSRHGKYLDLLTASEFFFSKAIAGCGLMSFCRSQEEFNDDDPLALFTDNGNPFELLFSQNEHLWKAARDMFMEALPGAKLIEHLKESEKYVQLDAPLYRAVFERETRNLNDFQYEAKNSDILNKRINLANTLSECAFANMYYGNLALTQIFSDKRFSLENISRWSGKTDLLRQFVELATVEQLKKAEFTDRQLLNPKVVAFLANGKNGEKLLALLGERKPSSVLELVRGDPKWKEALNLLPDDTMQSIAAHIKGKEPKEAKAAEKLLALLFTQREHINFFRSYFSAAEKGVVTEILKNVKVQFCHGDVITAFADLLMPFVSLGKLAESIMTDPSKKDSLLGNTLLLERITAAFTYIEDVLNKGKSILGENGKCFLDSFVDGDKERDIIGPIRFIRALAITSESFYSLNNPTLHKGYELLERLAANSTYDKALKLDEDESWIKNFFEKIPQDILEKAFSAAGHRHNDNLLNLALSYGNVDYASNTMVKKLALTFLRPEHRRTYISGCLNLANRFDGKLTGNDKFLNIQLKLAGKANIGNIFKVKIEVAIHLLEVIKNGEVVNMLLENLEQSLGGDLSEDYKKIATFIRLIIRQDKSDELAHWFSDLMPGAADETKEYTCNILKRYNFVFGYNFVSPPGSDILKNSTFKLNSAASEEKNYEEFYATISRSNPAVVMADEFRNPCFTDPILVDSFVRQADFDILESITDKQVTSSAVESWGTKDFSAFIQEKAKEDVVISLFDKTTDNNSTYFIGHINAFAKLASDTSLTEDNRAALKQKILTLASKISNDKVSGLCNEAVAILLPKLSCKQLHSLSTKQVDDLQDVSLKQLGAGQFDASEYNNGLPKRFLEKGNVDQIAKLLDATVNAFPSDAIAGIGVDRFKELVGSPRLLVRFLEEKNVPVKVKQAFSAKQLQLVWGELKTDRRKKLFESISYEIFTAWFSALEDASCTNGKDICKIIFDNCIGQGEQLINLRNFFPEEKITKITKDRLLDFLRSSSLCQDDVARWIREIVQTPKEAWDEFLDANNATAKNKKEFYILMGVDSFKNHFSKSLTKGQIKKFWEHKDLGTLIPMVSVDFFKLASNLPDNWTQAAQAMKGIKNEIISALLAQKKAVSLWDAKELAQMVNDSPKLFNDSNVVVGIIKRIDAATLQPGAFADNPAFLKRMDCAQIYDIPSDLFSDTDVGPRIIGNLTAGHFSDNAHCTNGAVKYFLRGGSVDEIAKLTEQQINQFQDGDYSLLDEDSLSRLCEKSPAPQYILSKIFTARENLQEHFPLTILTSLVDDNEDLFSTINQDVFASLMNSQSTTGDAVLQNAFCVQQCQKRFGTICSSGCSENLTAELSQKLLNTFPKDTFGGNWLKDLVVKERSSNPTKVNDSFSDFMFNSYGLEKAEVIAAPMVEQVLQGNANDGPQSANPLTQDVPPTTDSSTTTGNLSSLKTVCVVVGIVAGALALVGAIVAILFFACGLIPMALAGLLVWQIAAMLFAPAVLVGITGGILFAWYSVKKKKLNGEASDD
ncbi:MAG: hypothetical protein LBS68_01500 [Puniceicoccales bacterium]|nr:hypothetical protein [Puniceicoccales bacterium]